MEDKQQYTEAQMKEFEDMIKNASPVPIAMQMKESGLKFITDQLNLIDVEKYKKEQGIQIVNEDATIGRYEARVVFSDNHSEIILLREMK